MPCLASRVSLISIACVWWGIICWANVTSASLCASAAAVMPGAAVALGDAEWLAGCSLVRAATAGRDGQHQQGSGTDQGRSLPHCHRSFLHFLYTLGGYGTDAVGWRP